MMEFTHGWILIMFYSFSCLEKEKNDTTVLKKENDFGIRRMESKCRESKDVEVTLCK